MQYSPKLKAVMNEIKEILIKNDIAGFVAIHDPKGFVEYLNYLNPSYSCIKTNTGEIRVYLKAAELPGGKEEAEHLANKTYNMMSQLSTVISMNARNYRKVHAMLKEQWGWARRHRKFFFSYRAE